MNVSIKFLGAAQSVTGSKYLLEIDTKKKVVDCGLFQGLKELRLSNWDKLPIDPTQIDVVVITHAHIDHTGYLPRLVKDGFKGKIMCTSATEDLMQIMLLNAAGSRGRRLIEGEKFVRIFGNDISVNCHIREIHGLSAHANQSELMRWLGNFSKNPKITFITHGEIKSATTFSKLIEDKLGWKTIIPKYLEAINLFTPI